MQKKLIVALIAASILGLSACDKAKEVANKVEAETTKAVDSAKNAGSSSEEAISAKINKYVSVSNDLQKYFHESNEFFAKNRAEREAKAKAGDFKSIETNSSVFERSGKKLEEIAQMPGDTPDVDNAAKAYAAVITEYLPNWDELQSYNKAKKYEDDNGAKGKELLVKYNEGQAKLIAAQEAFEKVFKVAMDKEKVKRVAEYKAKGQLLELHTTQALENAGQMLEIFDDFADFKNQAKIDKANALLAELDTNLDAMNKEYQTQEAEKKLDAFNTWKSVHSYLVSFTGKYREARKDPKRYNDMVRDYNNAVDDYNRMMR